MLGPAPWTAKRASNLWHPNQTWSCIRCGRGVQPLVRAFRATREVYRTFTHARLYSDIPWNCSGHVQGVQPLMRWFRNTLAKG